MKLSTQVRNLLTENQLLKIVAGPIDHDTSVNTGTAPAPSATGEDKQSSYKRTRLAH